MTTAELIDDLVERIDRAVLALDNMRTGGLSPESTEWARLTGKISGLMTVKDWLRSYPPASGGG